MKSSSTRILATLFAVALAVPAFAQPRLTENNIDEVVAAMTLEEKATLLVGDAWGTRYPQSLPTDGSKYSSGPVYVPGAPFSTRPLERFGIPGTGMSDGPAGIRFNISREGTDKLYYATSFPVGTVMASTFNTELVKEMTTAMGDEVLGYGVDVILGPGMDIHRNPLCGRNFEYFSEDPFLSGKIAAAWVNGVQSNGVGVSAKHFAANDQETNRFYNDSRMNPRALREIALKGFEIMVKESQPWTIMSSYNKINGRFTQQDKGLLEDILRDEWGYTGIVITDWGYKEGTVEAVKAGNDLMEAGLAFEIDRIIEAVNNGTLPMADVDRNVRRVLQYIVKTPRFKGYKYDENPDLDAHAKLVREGAAEGLVLLKNDGETLPMVGVKKVALYGLNSYDMIAGGTGSGNVNKKYIRQLDEGLAENGIAVDEDIQKWYKDYITFQKTDAAVNASGPSVLLGAAVIPDPELPVGLVGKKVKENDMAIVTIGRNAGEGGDRTKTDGDWTLTAAERKMLQDVCDAYHEAGKKVVVVLNIGGVIETASWKNMPDAILLAWTPGQEVGYTVADVLSGKNYPSGKLPMTFPNNYFDIPSSRNFPYALSNESTMYLDMGQGNGRKGEPVKDFDYTEYKEGIWVGYRYFTTAGKDVSYPFGYGLGYTTFAYSNPSAKVASDGSITATITVRNTGKAVGKEAVQVYVTAPDGGLVKPDYELKGFAKTRELKPGESQTLTVKIGAYDLASFNESTSSWETAAGNYTVLFGASAEDLRDSAVVKLSKAQAWKTHEVCLPEKPVDEIKVK